MGADKFDARYWLEKSREYGMDDGSNSVIIDATERPEQVLYESSPVNTNQQRAVSVDMTRIDELLSAPNHLELDNLGNCLFMMLDRFSSAINKFAQEYIAACQSRDKDIADGEAEAKRLRAKVEEDHNTHWEEINLAKDSAIGTLKLQLQETANEGKRNIQRVRNECGQWKHEQELAIESLCTRNASTRERIEKDIVNKAKDCFNTVKGFVNRKNQALMEDVVKQTRRAQIFDEMRGTYLTDRYLAEMQKVYDAIFAESQKIIRHRLPDLCGQLSEMYANILQAFEMLKQEHRNAEESARINYSTGCTEREEQIRAVEQQMEREFSTAKANAYYRIEEEERSAAAQLDVENTHYEKRKQETNASIKVQNERRANLWYEELANKRTKFYSQMEVVFPASRMKALFVSLEKLKSHAEEAFSVGAEPMKNIAIGDARISLINQEVRDSEVNPIVIELLKNNYGFMFISNVEQYAEVVVPYIISVDEGAVYLLKYNDRFEEQIKDWVNGIGIRMLWSVPATLQEFCLLDTAAIGSYSSLQFMDPAQNPAAGGELVKSIIVGGRVYQRKDDMARQIDEMRVRFENRKGSMGSNRTLREFNRENFMSREAYQTAIIQHFPMNLNADSVTDLTTLARDCRKVGFSTILAMPDTSINYMEEKVQPRINDLEAYASVLKLVDGEYFVRESNSTTNSEERAKIYLYPTPDTARLTEMRGDLFAKSNDALKVSIDFDKVSIPKGDRYSASSGQGIVVPLGLMRGGNRFELRMDDIHVHTILNGVIRSGKTNLLHVLIMNTMLKYSPDEVSIYLIDFKHGVDFSIYGNYNLPNFSVLSITNEAEFPLAALEELDREFDRRALILGDSMSISDHNRMYPENKMKRILLIIDELYVLTRDSKKENNEDVVGKIIYLIDKIAHLAGAFGIHMLLCGQDTTKVEGFDNFFTQFGNRIMMHSSDDDVKKILGEGSAAVLMHEIKPASRGTCVYSNDFGETSQMAYTARLVPERQKELLKEISTHYSEKQEEADVRILLTDPSKSKYHPFSQFVEDGALPRPEKKDQLYIGVPPTLMKDFSYMPNDNLWVLGGDSTTAELAGYGVMFSSLLSLLLIKLKNQRDGKQMEILCSDGQDDEMGDIDRNDRFWQFCDALSEQGDFINYVAGNRLSVHIDRLTEIINMRRSGEESYPIWLIVSLVEECYGLPEQKKMELRRVIDEGPKHGIHTILWTKDADWASKFQLGAAPCDKLILETNNLEKFGIPTGRQNVARGFKAQLTGKQRTRLRLYDLPLQPWIEEVLQRIDKLR